VHNTASAPYSLKAMTVVAVIFLPLVLAHQTWTYYVFRRRVSREQFNARDPARRTARASARATRAARCRTRRPAARASP
jgi:hypothetical protein